MFTCICKYTTVGVGNCVSPVVCIGDVRWSHLLHRVFLFGDELQRSLEGSFDEQANLSVYELRRRLAVWFLRQNRRRLAAVKGQLTHRLVHTKLDNLKNATQPG